MEVIGSWIVIILFIYWIVKRHKKKIEEKEKQVELEKQELAKMPKTEYHSIPIENTNQSQLRRIFKSYSDTSDTPNEYYVLPYKNNTRYKIIDRYKEVAIGDIQYYEGLHCPHVKVEHYIDDEDEQLKYKAIISFWSNKEI